MPSRLLWCHFHDFVLILAQNIPQALWHPAKKVIFETDNVAASKMPLIETGRSYQMVTVNSDPMIEHARKKLEEQLYMTLINIGVWFIVDMCTDGVGGGG